MYTPNNAAATTAAAQSLFSGFNSRWQTQIYTHRAQRLRQRQRWQMIQLYVGAERARLDETFFNVIAVGNAIGRIA